jgi:GT2 family glycosyltransferase
MRPSLSIIVPFHCGLSLLTRCLAALEPLPEGTELIVAADGIVEDCQAVAVRHGARMIATPSRSGPASARNVAARAATGDVLVFIDADVTVSSGALERVARVFLEEPTTVALFGAYDERPADPGFVSQYKNLAHAYIHRSAATRARTFWTGFGAVRRDAFLAVGGFDERFRRPSVEDIDLGYRLTAAGYEVKLDPSLSACHMKRWTLGSMIVSDIRDRGIPWTQLLLRYGAFDNDLNLRAEYRLSVVLAYLALVSLIAALSDPRFLTVVPFVMAGLTLLNQRYYEFFYRKRGASFAVRVWLLHGVHHLYNGLSFTAGAALFAAARYLGLRLPGALPVDPWTAARSQ